MKLQVLVSLMSWFGVLSWVQAEFFTSIGMWQQNSSLPKLPSAKCKGLSLPEARSEWDSLVIDLTSPGRVELTKAPPIPDPCIPQEIPMNRQLGRQLSELVSPL